MERSLSILWEASLFRKYFVWIYDCSWRDQGMTGALSHWLEFPIFLLLWPCSDLLFICLHVAQNRGNRLLGPQRCIWIASHIACVFGADPGRVTHDVRARSLNFCIRVCRLDAPQRRSRCNLWIRRLWCSWMQRVNWSVRMDQRCIFSGRILCWKRSWVCPSQRSSFSGTQSVDQ